MNKKNIAKRIAIVGAGLGGLTRAAFLQRDGFAVTVYEQAPAFSRIGAGIILVPTSEGAAAVRPRKPPDGAGIKPRTLSSAAPGTPASAWTSSIFDAAHEPRFGGPYVHMHRGDLHGVLETRRQARIDRLQIMSRGPGDGGRRHRLVFANGATAEADIVIGADGIRSKVRDILLGAEPPRFAGAVAYRAIFPAARLGDTRYRTAPNGGAPTAICLAYYHHGPARRGLRHRQRAGR